MRSERGRRRRLGMWLGAALLSTGAQAGSTATTTMTVTRAMTATATATASTTRTASTTAAATATATRTSSRAVTSTATRTTTSAVTTTATLPTATRTAAATATLPTATATPQLTRSATLPAWDNYTAALEPDSFHEGQEIRLRIVATLGSASAPAFAFNATGSALGSFDVRAYQWTAASDDDCGKYVAAAAAPLYSASSFGVSARGREEGAGVVADAHVTLTAPHSSVTFVVCFRHAPEPTMVKAPAADWTLFSTGQKSKFTATQAQLWYHLPEPTEGQYAVVQLLSSEAWNFTYAPSACGAGSSYADLLPCGFGDNLKIVPAGQPCTVEQPSLQQPYLGTGFVRNDGTWEPEALPGLLFGATSGGAGRFGTQFGNPLVDSWTDWGTYYQANLRSDVASGAHADYRHAYAYVRLPMAVGKSYDVCFSSREQRIGLLGRNGTLDAVPAWRKVYRCSSASQCAAAAGGTSFTVQKETVGWGTYDITPNTWGTIVFTDNDTKLSTKKSTKRTNYWAPEGGDYFRIVSSAMLAESAGGAPSFPGAGCWSKALDTAASATAHGGWTEADAVQPAGSGDLTADPLGAGDATGNDDGQANAFSDLYFPNRLSHWYVCYRRTAGGGGMRVLPWAAPPALHKQLDDVYVPAHRTAGGGPTMLVPHEWGEDILDHPPATVWYMNDTRQGTWGPMMIDKANMSEPGFLDSRKWDGSATPAMGSRIKLVKNTEPCSLPGAASAMSDNGGAVECNSKSAEIDGNFCMGTAADSAEATAIAFYITVPAVRDAGYRVCFRPHRWNWREVAPTVPSADGFLRPAADPLATLSVVYAEERKGMDALFVVSDSRKELAAFPRDLCPNGCDASGDVLRLVPADQKCDINPRSWAADAANGPSTDSQLSPICLQAGAGTVQQSGLYTADPCKSTPQAAHFCGGAVCGASADTTYLAAMVAKTPDLYDDIVPYGGTGGGLGSVAAHVKVPAAGTYSVCYKQSSYQNWVVLTSNYTTYDAGQRVVKWMSKDLAGAAVVGGETLDLSVAVDNAGAVAAFYAKFVKAGYGPSSCENPAAGTQSEAFAASTTKFNSTDAAVTFSLLAPQKPGTYDVCVQVRHRAEDSMSWSRVEGVKVVDNGVRWFVTSGNTPTNQGVSVIGLTRLPASADVFMTAAGEDAAKVVAVTAACTDESEHVAVPAVSDPKQGVTNLGPADGASATAHFVVSLPKVANDAATLYKLCVKTRFNDNMLGAAKGRRVWVEVEQGKDLPDQVPIYKTGDHPAFKTQAAGVSHWTLSARLHPAEGHLLTGQSLANDAVALAGASTVYVKSPAAASGTDVNETGFAFSAYSGASLTSADSFKMVLAALPPTPMPSGSSDWGKVSDWESVDGASCMSAPAGSATNLVQCAPINGSMLPGACPGVDANGLARFHLPLHAAKYLVCYRRAAGGSPWLTLSSAGGSDGLYVHPAFLSFQADAGSPPANLTAYDTATVTVNGSGVEAVASWCSATGAGPNCATDNNAASANSAYDADLLVVVRDPMLCPPPAGGPNGAGAGNAGEPYWWRLAQNTNESVRVDGTGPFQLPPVNESANAQYRICAYKAGRTVGGGAAQQGLVYQLHNRGPAASGGGTGFWTDSAAAGTPSLLVTQTTDLEYNSSYRFVEYQAGFESIYGEAAVPAALVTDDVTGQVSRTPLITSGDIVDFVVEVAAGGEPTQFGTHEVEVLRCATPSGWTSLECSGGSGSKGYGPTENAPFDVVDVGPGSCNGDEAEEYGAPENGLVKRLSSGRVKFSLQFRSGCGGTEFGCGIVFRTTPPGATEPVYSAPQWINVRSPLPTSVALKSKYSYGGAAQSLRPEVPKGASCVPPDCYQARCMHRMACEVEVLARHGSGREYAAAGKVGVAFSAHDYASVSSHTQASVPTEVAKSVQISKSWSAVRRSWQEGGEHKLSTEFTLRGSEDSVALYLNVTFGADDDLKWSRFIITVERAQPTAFHVHRISPLDTAGLPSAGLLSDPYGSPRSPAPAFEYTKTAAGASVAATAGAYLEALVPYELVYAPMSGDKKVSGPTDSLKGWTVDAAIPASAAAANAVLKVIDRDGNVSPDNLRALSATTSAFSSEPLSYSGAWATRFRIKNNRGCSRFSGDGCEIVFTFSKQDVKKTIKVLTPVRVVATTLEVQAGSGTAAAASGLEVTVYPGTACGAGCFLYDEYHYGDVFAMLSEPYAVDGATTRDGAMLIGPSECTSASCAVPRYTPTKIGSKWGARWTLATTKPCMNCEVTFHSTWGAGPVDAHGSLKFSLTDEALALTCDGEPASQKTVQWPRSRGSSMPFTVALAARTAQGVASAKWPRWTVAATSSVADYSLSASGGALGFDAAGSMKLTLSGAAPTEPLQTTITFRAVATSYSTSTDAVGSIETGQAEATCTVSVTFTAADVASTMQVTDAGGASPLCAGEYTSCTKWQTVTSSLASGVTFTTKFMTADGETDTSPRNLTALRWTGSSYAGSQVWRLGDGGLESTYVSSGDEITIPTAYDAAAPTGSSDSYGFGKLAVEFTRPNGGGVSNGQGTVTIKYAGATDAAGNGWPCRDCRFRLCGQGASGDACADISLWVTPPADPPLSLVVYSAPAAGTFAPGVGGSNACGGGDTALSFQVGAYYTMAGTAERFLSYASPLRFSLSIGSGVLAPKSDVRVTNTSVTATNGVPMEQGPADTLLSTATHADLLGKFEVYGVAAAAAATASFTAVDQAVSTRVVTGTATTETYGWAAAAEEYAAWRVEDAVVSDDECPSKRTLPSHSDGYRADVGPPGKGWEFSEGAQVGVPVPIQTTVTTGTGARAWTYPNVMVAVTKVSTSGCNDGGQMSVMQLAASAATDVAAPRSSGINGNDGLVGWTAPAAAGTVVSNAGSSIAWLVFGEPCESCSIRLDLCYEKATGAADCLSAGSSTADSRPPLGGRTKFTKTFSVKKFEPTTVQVRKHSAPVKDGETKVGAAFSVDMDYTGSFGGKNGAPVWTLTSKTAASWEGGFVVKSQWEPADALDAGAMKYGHGGFIGVADVERVTSGGSAEACGAVDQSAAAAAAAAMAPTQADTLSFYYTRPCSRCSVKLWYSIDDKMGSIGLQIAPFRVTTCGTKWMLAGAPPRVVSRREPFSLSVWKVDTTNLPDWAAASETVGVSALPSLPADGANNGAGGELMHASPGVSSGGTATVRLRWSRSCYRCAVSVAQQTHHHTVLTGASRVVAQPAAGTDESQVIEAAGDVGTYAFEVYAADEMGDRAFGVGGPNAAVFVANHAPAPSAAVISVAERTEQTLLGVAGGISIVPVARKDASAPGGQTNAVYDGRPTAVVLNGTHVRNGMPVDGNIDKLGQAVVGLSGLPGAAFPVSFTGFGADLPTTTLAGAPVRVDFTPRADRIAVEDVAAAACKDALVGSSCTFRAFAFGPAPNDPQSAFLAVGPVDGQATAAADCTPAGCSARLGNSSVSFVRGVASFSLQLTGTPDTGADCTCTVVVSPPSTLANASDQTLSVPYKVTTPNRFVWAGSDSLPAPDASGRVDSVPNRTVVLRMVAVDAAGVGGAGVTWPAGTRAGLSTDAMAPVGCFVPAGSSETSSSGAEIRFQGYFSVEGSCSIPSTAVTDLPAETPASGALTVTTRTPAGIRVRRTAEASDAAPSINFTGMTGMDSLGEAVAVSGSGAQLIVEVVDSAGTVVAGDFHTVVTVDGSQNSPSGASQPTLKATAVMGVATVTVVGDLNPDGQNISGNVTVSGDWYFTATASSGTLAQGSSFEVGKLASIGPLPVLRKASKLSVMGRHGSSEWRALDSAMGWVGGSVITVVMKASCNDGLGDAAPCDGVDSSVLLQPSGIPCMAAQPKTASEMSRLWDGSGVSISGLKPCGTGGWAFKGTQGNSVQLQNGRVEIGAVYGGQSGPVSLTLYSTELTPVQTTLKTQRPAALKSYIDVGNVTVQQPLSGVVTMVDTEGDRVAADSFSRIRMQSRCLDPSASSYIGSKDGDTVKPILKYLVDGNAMFTELYFSGPCKNMTLVLTCEPDSALDSDNVCRDMPATTTDPFEVALADGAIPPKLPPASAPITVGMNLGTVGGDDATAAMDKFDTFIAGVQVDDFTKATDAVLAGAVQQVDFTKLQLICALPLSRSANGITPEDRTNTASDQSKCVDYSAPAASAAADGGAALLRVLHPLQTAVELALRTEFDVHIRDDAGGVGAELLAPYLTQAIEDDLTSGDTLRRLGGEAFALVNVSDLGLTTFVTSTPAPTDTNGSVIPGLQTPAPTPGDTDAPEEPDVVPTAPPQPPTTRPPTTSNPTAEPTDLAPEDGPTITTAAGCVGSGLAVVLTAAVVALSAVV